MHLENDFIVRKNNGRDLTYIFCQYEMTMIMPILSFITESYIIATKIIFFLSLVLPLSVFWLKYCHLPNIHSLDAKMQIYNLSKNKSIIRVLISCMIYKIIQFLSNPDWIGVTVLISYLVNSWRIQILDIRWT